jgi:hypothetical protein
MRKNLCNLIAGLILVGLIIMAGCGGGMGSSGGGGATYNPLVAPKGVTASASKSEVTLRWNNVDKATSYNIYWSTKEILYTGTATKIKGVTSPYVHTGLSSDATYYYVVTASNDSFEGPESLMVFANPGWQTETLAPTAASARWKEASIATDSSGHAHIHYSFDETIGTAGYNHNYYMTNMNGTWVSVPVGNPSGVDANIALDSSNTVHVSYADFQGVTHAIYAGGVWTKEVIGSRMWGECESSLALDLAGKVYLAFDAMPQTAAELMYASNASGAWVREVLSSSTRDIGCVGPGTISIAVEADGTSHIAYRGRYPDYGLKYITNQSGAWVTSTLDPGYITGVSAAVDSNGNVHVAYTDNYSHIKYAQQDVSGLWTTEVVESRGSPIRPSLVLDASGNVHISYVSGLDVRYQLKYAKKSNGTWRIIALDSEADYTGSALALDSLNKVHISYFSTGNLKYITNK